MPDDARTAGGMEPALYLVATPIGNARDITLRALDVLRGADLLVAEDTRVLRRLMEMHGVARAGRRILALHDHNEREAAEKVVAALAGGAAVACTSDAGTPLISDPGHHLVGRVIAAGHAVHAIPGPSAAIAALAVAGLPSDRFLFAGFPPAAAGERRRFIEELAAVPAVVILYESPHRLRETFETLEEILGGARRAALCRELTKLHEEVMRGTLAELRAAVERDPPRGEITLVIDRAEERVAGEDEIRAALRDALQTMSVKDSVELVAHALSVGRRRVYQLALAIRRD